MSDKLCPQKMSDDELEGIAGGTTREYRAAWDVVNGAYGAGVDCRNRLAAQGLNVDKVMYLAGGLGQGYYSVALDICRDCYGSGQDRRNRLIAAGYDPDMAQAIVNGMLLNS
jgi:hypothetical protein